MNQVTAQLNGLRLSPRKVRALVDLIRRKSVPEALDQLAHYVRRGSPHLVKLLNSAVANAKNNFKMEPETLYIKEIIVDEGIKLKRFMPKGFGRAGEIQKKTSRIRVVLEQKVVASAVAAPAVAKADVATEAKAPRKARAPRTANAKKL